DGFEPGYEGPIDVQFRGHVLLGNARGPLLQNPVDGPYNFAAADDFVADAHDVHRYATLPASAGPDPDVGSSALSPNSCKNRANSSSTIAADPSRCTRCFIRFAPGMPFMYQAKGLRISRTARYSPLN